MKKLYKSWENKVLTGLVGGMGEYFDVDPVLLRVAWIIVTAVTGFVPGIVAYVVAALIVPVRQKAEPAV